MRTYLVVALFVVSVPAVAHADDSDSTPTSSTENCCQATALASEDAPEDAADLFGADVLFGGTPTYGVYLAPAMEAGRIGDQTGVLFGGRGGLIVSDVLRLGGGMNWLIDGPTADTDGAPAIRMRHGGGLIGLTLSPDQIIHPTFDVMLGGGRISLDRDAPLSSDEHVRVLVLDMASGFDLNLTHGIRVHVGGGYRHVSSFELEGLTDDDVDGFFASLQLKFGSF